MAIIAERKYPGHPILSLFPFPIETESRIYYEDDLVEMGFLTLLDGLSSEMRLGVLHQTDRLTRIKPELGFHFLRVHEDLLTRVPFDQLGPWVNVVLDLYDSSGLNPAREFILQLDRHPEFVRFWGEGLSFQEIYGVLQHYANALTDSPVTLKTGPTNYTDTQSIYLPERIGEFPERDDNFLLYKAMVTYKIGQILLRTYQPDQDMMNASIRLLEERYGRAKEDGFLSTLSLFFHLFPYPRLASDLYLLLEALRIENWMSRTLPGLHGNMIGLKKQLGLKRDPVPDHPPKSRVIEALILRWLTGYAPSIADRMCRSSFDQLWRHIQSWMTQAGHYESISAGKTLSALSAETVIEMVYLLDTLPGPYEKVGHISFMGELMPEEAEKGQRKKRESTKARFQEELFKLIQSLPECKEFLFKDSEMISDPFPGHQRSAQEVPRHLILDGTQMPIPAGMQKIIEDIYEDLGTIPGSYLGLADDMSGHHFRDICEIVSGAGNVLSELGKNIHVYDEWDYRRHGYRKRWALLRETDVPEGQSSFSDDTLTAYRGLIQRIKRQFERIRTEQCLLKRQIEGDHLDLDALIEAISDRRVGLSPSERVFGSIRRDKRDIGTAFLIDLSGSTSGWINDMERASLLILSEALQVLKDRFAIYGFSGRTRKRCELFRIKGFDEPYGDKIRGRIANLRALEYTRLGPPIRHLTRLLKDIEVRTRLLITLSDGKPDDYDGYKGDYGIEDTRQALVEAKRLHIHPFCITIDKAEHSYLSHMFGPANYIFIDDISKLPLKIPEIYRQLTT